MRKYVVFDNTDVLNAEYGYLSNDYPCIFTVQGVTFSSITQYYVYMEAKTYCDESTAEKVLKTEDIDKIMELRRQIRISDTNLWHGVKQILLYEGLIAKFENNRGLKDKLIATSGSILVATLNFDSELGNGNSIHNADMQRLDETTKISWRGQNLLGYTLMKVRDKFCNR